MTGLRGRTSDRTVGRSLTVAPDRALAATLRRAFAMVGLVAVNGDLDRAGAPINATICSFYYPIG